jgi:hypothetical protein
VLFAFFGKKGVFFRELILINRLIEYPANPINPAILINRWKEKWRILVVNMPLTDGNKKGTLPGRPYIE